MSKKQLTRAVDLTTNVADHWNVPLKTGKPEKGWSGDPALELRYNTIEARWQLFRHEPEPNNPERMVMVANGPIGGGMNDMEIDKLIDHLIDVDTTRPGNSAVEQMDRLIKENERLDAKRTEYAAEALAEPLAKFYFEVAKVYGVKTDFYF